MADKITVTHSQKQSTVENNAAVIGTNETLNEQKTPPLVIETNEPETPLVEDTKVKPSVVVKETQVDNSTAFQKTIAKIKESGTASEKGLVASIELYMEKLKPGVPVNETDGARIQYNLWKTISALLESYPDSEFKRLWYILLAYFEEYKDAAMHERYIFRFAEYWSWSDTELFGFQRIINIIKLTSNPTTRSSELKKVDLDRSLEVGFSDKARQRVINFYKQ